MTNVWTAVASPNVASFTYPCGVGTPTNALIFMGGSIAPEIFNGSAWVTQSGTNGQAMSGASGFGTPTSVISVHNYSGYAILWNGTTWSTIADMGGSYVGAAGGGCGSINDGLAAGQAAWSYTYNGVSWTSKGSPGGSNSPQSLFGTTGSALAIFSGSTSTRLWSGAAWSAGGTRISSVGGGGTGDDSSGVAFGAQTCQEWSGTTWSGANSLPVSISLRAGGAGDTTLALAFAVTACKYDTQVLIAPVANFSAVPVAGAAALNVVFTDLSTNIPDTWDWDFGDSTAHGTTMNPTHTYVLPGSYTVVLTVSNVYGSDVETKTDYIFVSGSTGPSIGTMLVGDRVMVARTSGQSVAVRI